MQQIKVTIATNGAVSYEVSGVKGAGCKKLTEAIDRLSRVIETKKTAEFYQVATEAQRVQNKQ